MSTQLPEDVANKLWERYIGRWDVLFYPITKDAVVQQFQHRGYSTEEDIERFLTAVAFDEWYCASFSNDGAAPWTEKFNKYVNVYQTAQMYGGPEEGGWYYEVGDPLASVPVPLDMLSSEVEVLGKKLLTAMGYLETPDDISVCVEAEYAYPYPRQRPHYE